MEFKCAEEKDYTEIRDFYYSLIDAMQNSELYIGWEKDVYPTQEFLHESIQNKELYFFEINGSIVSCMVVNHSYNEGYRSVSWLIDAKDEELFVIHALGVHPFYSGQGIAKQMVQEVFNMAKIKGIKAIRLDVLSGNAPAEKTYTKMGFQYLTTIPMFYEDTGWTEYKVFEYIVSEV